MPEVSDVDLMELADGTLGEPRRELVEAELARRPELQQRLEVFRATGKALARLFDPVMQAPLPPGLLDALRDPGSPPVPHVLHLTSGMAPVKGRRRFADALNGWPFASGMAWAAAVVAVVGLGAAIWGLRSDTTDGFAIAPLSLALEKTPSGQSAALVLAGHGPGFLKPDLSFRHVDGRHCRQYEVTLEAGRGLAGYACRVGSGQWRVEKETEMTLAKVDRPGVIRPSGRDPGVKAIDDAVDSVIRGDALEADRELELIRRGWSLEGRQ